MRRRWESPSKNTWYEYRTGCGCIEKRSSLSNKWQPSMCRTMDQAVANFAADPKAKEVPIFSRWEQGLSWIEFEIDGNDINFRSQNIPWKPASYRSASEIEMDAINKGWVLKNSSIMQAAAVAAINPAAFAGQPLAKKMPASMPVAGEAREQLRKEIADNGTKRTFKRRFAGKDDFKQYIEYQGKFYYRTAKEGQIQPDPIHPATKKSWTDVETAMRSWAEMNNSEFPGGQYSYELKMSYEKDTVRVMTVEEKRKAEGLCPNCGEKGRYHMCQAVCSKHGPY